MAKERSRWRLAELATGTVLAVGALLIAGCEGAPTGPDDPGATDLAPLAQHKPGHPGGGPGGGDDGGDSGDGGPTSGNVITSFRDAAGDAITSDATTSGTSDYGTIKKRGQITSEVTNRLWLAVNANSGREVCVTFPAEGPDAVIHQHRRLGRPPSSLRQRRRSRPYSTAGSRPFTRETIPNRTACWIWTPTRRTRPTRTCRSRAGR